LTYQFLQVLESASVLKEIGAAVSIGAGGGKILRRFNIHLDREGGIIPERFAIWTTDGKKLAEHAPPSSAQYGDDLVSAAGCDLTCRAVLTSFITHLGVNSSS
jgi:hypothetical protein